MATLHRYFYTDAAHGWLRVSMTEARELGILDQVSSFSYTDGVDLYLEEDCDAPKYIKAVQSRGDVLEFSERYCDGDSPIRELDYFSL